MLLAWTKIVLADELLESDLPDDPYLRDDLLGLLPDADAARTSRRPIEEHPLRREIIVTQVVNDLVNGAGMTFWPRLAGETGRDRGRPDPGQLRRPRDLRLAASCARRSPRSTTRCSTPSVQTRMRHRDAHPGRAGVALAGHQPPAAARRQGDGRVLPRPVQAGDGRAARADERPRARRLPATAREAADRARACPRSWPRGSRCCRRPTRCSASSRSPTASDLDPVEVARRALRARRAARPAGRWSSGSSRCRATTGGRRWRGPRCATTSTPCTRS